MIPTKYSQLTFGFFLSIFMSCVVSGVSVLNTTGWVDGFLNMWMTAWFKSWIVAFPTVLVVDLSPGRLIPSSVKQTVFIRDGGKCVECGSSDNLHFDHILPYSKGGTSYSAENVQILCARHNLSKSAKIL